MQLYHVKYARGCFTQDHPGWRKCIFEDARYDLSKNLLVKLTLQIHSLENIYDDCRHYIYIYIYIYLFSIRNFPSIKPPPQHIFLPPVGAFKLQAFIAQDHGNVFLPGKVKPLDSWDSPVFLENHRMFWLDSHHLVWPKWYVHHLLLRKKNWFSHLARVIPGELGQNDWDMLRYIRFFAPEN